jgi:glutamate synthase (NADPH/NADH) small chain
LERTGEVRGSRSGRTELDADGNVSPIDGSEYTIPADRVFRATGQAKRIGLLSSIDGVAVDSEGRVAVGEDYRTGNERIWAGGDCVNGGMEVVNAVQHGKLAARSIDESLRSAVAV